jgi:ADP-ribose pyrophosphatase YjhB (NUDIX family)
MSGMITFDIGQARFTHRVAAVCIHDAHVLLQRSAGDSFWFLPGGRVEIMESAEAALKREMREELKLESDVQVERLLWVVENFFTDEEGAQNHEIGFYYQIAFNNNPELYDKSKSLAAIEDTGLFADEPVSFALHWFPLDTLDDIPLYPTFLKAGLRSLPVSVQHIVHRDPEQ